MLVASFLIRGVYLFVIREVFVIVSDTKIVMSPTKITKTSNSVGYDIVHVVRTHRYLMFCTADDVGVLNSFRGFRIQCV